MNKTTTQELYKKLTLKLLDAKWIEKSGLNEDFIKNHVENLYFINKTNSLIEKTDYSCRGVLSLCQGMMAELAGENPPADWLHYVYQYALHKSFPHAVEIELSPSLNSPCELYLRILSVFDEFQKNSGDGTWQSKYPVEYLTEEEERSLENSWEYDKFIEAFKGDNIYEMMKLHQELTGHNTLDHICGVHNLALFIGRQLYKAGLPVDLGRVSGAAAGHDIGKYGCSRAELKRVPYLHYYYTDYWFKKFDITYIRHIAVNHSTWDLELENLPLESLILIYADFRVKNQVSPDNTYEMRIFNLDESFDVILQKLDNVDAAKEKRYKRVYAKLKDFENYVIHLGVNVDIHFSNKIYISDTKLKYNYSLMQGEEILNNFKYLSIEHNILLMHKLRDEYSLNLILEQARSQKDWKKLREYIQIFEEYSTYLTQKQKLIMMKFLYEQLTRREDDIRRQCAELMGAIIAMFDEDYRKEVPENAIIEKPEITSAQLFDKYIQLFITPDYRIIPTHRMWIGSSLSIMISSLFSHCRKRQINDYRNVLMKYYDKDMWEEDIHLFLLEAAKYIPISHDSDTISPLFDYVLHIFKNRNNVIKLASQEVILTFIQELKHKHPFRVMLNEIFSGNAPVLESPPENYLNLKIARLLNVKEDVIAAYESNFNESMNMISDIFLSNLKTATHYITKRIQVEMLLEYALEDSRNNALYTAMHFCNLLKVSAVESVRNYAGEALLFIVPFLSLEQRNDVAVELLRALEIEGYQFAKYIPHYLGQVILFLQPKELDELIDDLVEKIKQSSPTINSLLLKTIGITIANYHKYSEIFSENERDYNKRLVKLLGILLNGLVHYNLQVKQVALSVIGKEIFGSNSLKLKEKNMIFQLIAKKILTLMTDSTGDELVFLINSAVLNHIYRFIADYTFFNGNIELNLPGKIAFFPGTFDPFSLSHKEITKQIRDMGFEVYLSVDEFSWSKQTIPNSLRRDIISMSVADELNIYLYPEDISTNIASPEDLKNLRDNFPGSNVYIVAGSDVLINASSYKADKSEHSIHTFPHIIFDRRSLNYPGDHEEELNEASKKIEGEIIRLALPPQYEDISSTQIRGYIDENRDITSLIDPLAQKYVYEFGLYRREPQYKPLMQPLSIDIEVVENITTALIDRLSALFNKNYLEVYNKLNEFSHKLYARLILIRDVNQGGRILGFSAFHWIRSTSLYNEIKNSTITEYVRENAVGRIIMIDGIFIDRAAEYENLEQILLTETLSFCLAKDYDYAVFHNLIGSYHSPSLLELLKLHGFNVLPYGDESNPFFVVNMNSPCTLYLDAITVIKEPFRSNSNVEKAIIRSRKRLQMAIAQLYPGNLVLSFNSNLMYETLIRKICAENGVPTRQETPRRLGSAMCVPFGTILKRHIIPNTVTKSLHTEKLFAPDMKSSKIGPFPYYMSLENQVKMLHSFNRSIILVDDLLHNGYRIKALDPLLKKENLKVQKIIVGILSGKGKELMDIQDREVESAYFIPKLKIWFNESSQYPFIGGDTLWRGVYPQRYIIPSINLILPYTSPTFIKNSTKSSIYNLSKVCIENAIDILTTLENEYQLVHERNLSLASLGDVFIVPRCPDHGLDMNYDFNLSPSHYLQNDLELLKRMEYIINETRGGQNALLQIE